MGATSVTGTGTGDAAIRLAYLSINLPQLEPILTTTNSQNLITGIFPSSGGGPTLLANTFFVAKNGNDSTGDGSVSKPFLTVQAGINAA